MAKITMRGCRTFTLLNVITLGEVWQMEPLPDEPVDLDDVTTEMGRFLKDTPEAYSVCLDTMAHGSQGTNFPAMIALFRK